MSIGGRIVRKIALSLCVIFSLAGCPLPASQAGTGTLRLYISAVQPKTILPTVTPQSYVIVFSGPATMYSRTIYSTTDSIELATGTWSISVLGRDADGATIAQGSASGIAINSGSTTAASVYLRAVASGTGTISLTVSWTDVSDPMVDGYSMTLNGSPVDSSTGVTFDTTAHRLVYAASCAAGDYRYVIELKQGTTTVATNSDAIQVYANLPSSGTIALDSSDFQKKPMAPSGLTTAEVSSHFTLAWTDNSKVETEYQVERGTDGTTFSSLATGLFANTTSYSDTSETLSDQTYYYRVAAVNTFGSSYSDHIACKLSSGNLGQIIADHSIVDKYADIPTAYIALVKKMWLDVPGESHSEGYRNGLALLAAQDARFAVSVTESGTPEAATEDHLRASRATWGDLGNASGWVYGYGEEDWYTNATAIARTKAHLDYCNTNGYAIAAMGFGWCWDMTWTNGPSGTVDPVYGTRWAGTSQDGPQGNLIWGLNAEDTALTGNSVCMDTYLSATQAYIDYCTSKGYATKVFFTTGPVDGYYPGENGYQRAVKHEYIRTYVKADPSRILFDYADILCYSDDGSQNIQTFTDTSSVSHSYPVITSANLGSADIGHIGSAGRLRLAKALWWMLARMAGWDGVSK